MIVTVIQIFFVLALVLLIIVVAFKIRKTKEITALPENYRELLNDYVKFYRQLDEEGKEKFEKRVEQFLSAVQITGVNAVVEDIDLLLIAAGAIIPVYAIPDWQYINLHEVLLYPGAFNRDFDQEGADRGIAGMVGTGAMQNVMIITKWQLRQGFINDHDAHNTAIHEFVHLIDKMDGTMDGVPEIILERRYITRWKNIMDSTIVRIKTGRSDIDMYAATNPAEFFAVEANHPELYEMLARIYKTAR